MNDSDVNDPSGMTDDQGETRHPVPEQPNMTSPGARLAAYRQERGWTIEQVASQLNLAPRQIVAIESDDYPSLPGMPIVRGFIRAYAKLLKIDPAPLLAMVGGETVLFNEAATPKKPLSTPFSERSMPSMTDRPGLSSKWIVGLLLGVLLGVAIWAAQQGKDIGQSAKVISPPATEEVASTANIDVSANKPVEAGSGQNQLSTAPGASGDSAAMQSGQGSGSNPLPISMSQFQGGAEVAHSEVSPATAGKNVLLLKMREDSWIEIRRAEGNDVFISRIARAGETEAFDVTAPVTVVIGNASGVEASLRGKPLALKAGSNNVARLNVK